ncbi:MAG: hypothetical protein R6T83_00345 [Salinibacter sp.]
MIKVTILDAQKLAQKQMGAQAMAAGARGANIESAVRNQVANHLEKGFASKGVEVTVRRSGSRGLEINIEDPKTAAWNQGLLAWLVASIMPSTVDHTLAPTVENTLKESGIEAEVSVE